ncbi:hypothetical protein AAGS61_09325 [Lysinibacillus sp. KU-BSD001]|uniref:hypothetical protein n=1 Tax=Lysinibacillus sp. KU-BSD001 TaxID=3141328 RepID=UPI0036E18CB3
MSRMILIIVSCIIILPIAIGATVVYSKKVNEKEQLILSEVIAFIHKEERNIDIEQLTIVKPTIFSGYDEWYVERIDTNEIYHYQNGQVIKTELSNE